MPRKKNANTIPDAFDRIPNEIKEHIELWLFLVYDKLKEVAYPVG